jgi:hypothetical protein
VRGGELCHNSKFKPLPPHNARTWSRPTSPPGVARPAQRWQCPGGRAGSACVYICKVCEPSKPTHPNPIPIPIPITYLDGWLHYLLLLQLQPIPAPRALRLAARKQGGLEGLARVIDHPRRRGDPLRQEPVEEEQVPTDHGQSPSVVVGVPYEVGQQRRRVRRRAVCTCVYGSI